MSDAVHRAERQVPGRVSGKEGSAYDSKSQPHPRCRPGLVPDVLGKDMSTFANATFTIESWDEKPVHEEKGLPKMTHVWAVVSYRGDIEGEGRVEYLMTYRPDGSAVFLGMERVKGGLAGYRGSFVLQHAGSFESGTAKSTFSVVPGSGTGKLASLRGHGEYAAADCDTPITLQYDIDGVEEDRESVLVAPAPIPTGP